MAYSLSMKKPGKKIFGLRFRDWGLRSKLVIVNSFAFITVFIIFFGLFISAIENSSQQNQEDKAKSLEKNISIVAEHAILENSFSNLQILVKEIALSDRDIDLLYVANHNGIIIASSDEEKYPVFFLDKNDISKKYINNDINKDKINKKTVYWVQNHLHSIGLIHAGKKTDASGQKLSDNKRLLGYFFIALNNNRWVQTKRKFFLFTLIIFFFLFVLAFSGTYLGAVMFTRPISDLAQKVRGIATGNLQTPVYIDRKDEIGLLANDVDLMRLKIYQSFDRIEQQSLEIRNHNQDLENKVNERTRKLRDALDILQEKDAALANELNLAAEIQKGILPPAQGVWDGLEYSAMIQPMERVSGDFYEVIKRRDFFNVIVSDVSGHGVPAALVTMAAKQIFQTQTVMKRTPTSFFKFINEEIYNRITTTDYLTIFNLYFTNSQDFIYSSAGHNPALLWRYNTKRVKELSTDGVLIGVFPDAGHHYEERREHLYPGDKILIFTDGMIEQENPRGEPFGEKRLKQCFEQWAHLSPKKLVDHILREFHNFRESVGLQDDISLFALQLTPHYYEAMDMVKQAKDFLSNSEFEEALLIGKKIYALTPFLPDGHYIIGVSYFYLKRYDKALEFLKKYLSKFLDSVTSVGYMYFRCLIETGQIEQALVYGKKVLFEDMPVSFYEDLYFETQKIYGQLKQEQ